MVGAAGTVVNMAALYVLAGVIGMGHMAAAVIAVEASVVFNFVMHERWTFSDRRPGGAIRRVLTYHAVSAASIGITLFMQYALTAAGCHYLAAQLVGIFLGAAINFTGATKWAWRKT